MNIKHIIGYALHALEFVAIAIAAIPAFLVICFNPKIKAFIRECYDSVQVPLNRP